MGLNEKGDGIRCPDCGQPQPGLRRPNSLRQTLVGGWSCVNCGCEMDKSGQKIEAAGAAGPPLSDANHEQEWSAGTIVSFDDQGRSPLERLFEEENK